MNWISYRWRLSEIQRSEWRLRRQERFLPVEQREFDLDTEARARLVSEYWLSHADRHHLPTPPLPAQDGENAYWVRTYPDPHTHDRYTYRLTERGLTEVRSTVRLERAAKHDSWSRAAVLVTGLIGALTGLVAVLMD